MDGVHSQLSSSDVDAGQTTVEQVQKQLEAVQSSHDAAQRQIESKMDGKSRQQSRLAALKENVNRLTERKLRLTDNLQQRGSLVERQRVLSDSVGQSKSDIESCQQQMQPLIGQRSEAQAGVHEAQRRRNESLEVARAKIAQLQEMVRQVRSLDAHIQRWSADCKDTQLEQGQAKVEHIEAEKLAVERAIDDIRRKISELKLTLNNSEAKFSHKSFYFPINRRFN